MRTQELVESRVGRVYVVARPDLMKCYVGQTTVARRPWRHLKPGRYQYDELCGDGGVPNVDIVEHGVPGGTLLDEAERKWMRILSAQGWNVINRLGPDEDVNFLGRLGAFGGRVGGHNGGKALAARRATDPEFDARWRTTAAKAGAAAYRARRAVDFELDARMREHEIANLQRGVERRQWLWENDPQWRAAQRERASLAGRIGGRNGGRATAKIQRVCVECGLGPTTPGGLGYHQSRTGHVGYTTPVREEKYYA